jgi:hypothetical protein
LSVIDDIERRTGASDRANVIVINQSDKPKDPVSAMLLEEQVVRESVIAHEEINKLREKVQECYWREGVNHLENW